MEECTNAADWHVYKPWKNKTIEEPSEMQVQVEAAALLHVIVLRRRPFYVQLFRALRFYMRFISGAPFTYSFPLRCVLT